MKVLFAVSNEEISESIVKKYQKEYKQIISYKNVYYFNAILKEIQKDKSYDRIVISEDLEAFTHTQYDQIDKFIFEKLDGISDEATNSMGSDMPIILICSDRRTKSEQMLVKLFGIGIYNAIIGTDRSVDEVCNLIRKPRTKKEAKLYYKIESDEIIYKSETENDVSEIEIQNILAHYKRLGKNEDRYIDSFNNIAAQYNDTQLRIISKFLPLNVRAVLEEKSPKYQQVMSFNNSITDNLRNNKKEDTKDGPSEKLLKPKVKDKIMSKPVVIPSSVNMNSNKKLSRTKIQQIPVASNDFIEKSREEQTFNARNDFVQQNMKFEEDEKEEINELPKSTPEAELNPVKRGRGRPRKNPIEKSEEPINKIKRGRGRPRKNPEPVQDEILPGLSSNIIEQEETEDDILSGLSPIPEYQQAETNNDILPGLSIDNNDDDESYDENILPGIDQPTLTFEDEDENILPGTQSNVGYNSNDISYRPQQQYANSNNPNSYSTDIDENKQYNNMQSEVEKIDLSNLLTPDKKIATFVGTSKNGTSFVVNNLAELLSSMGINTAILDTTKNRNSYYIYTKNEEELRNIAARSIEKLADGEANGIKVSNNLTVYTSLPNEGEAIVNTDRILESLLRQHSLILIDSDFDTPSRYFEQSQETYLVQTLDILTIQPLTAFLRELKAKNILDEKKLKVIINKAVKIRGINDKTIIGGMAYYNDPAMSFMTELFDRDMMKYVSLPFEEETYIKYLQSIIECNISLKGYSKAFIQTLKELANMVYPMGNNMYRPPSADNRGVDRTFSPNINSTLNQMKNNY